MTLNIVSNESKIEELFNQLTGIGFEPEESTRTIVYYKDMYYTVYIDVYNKRYSVDESSLYQKLKNKHYDNESYKDLFDDKEYALIEDEGNVEIVSFNNAFDYLLSKEGFSYEEIRYIQNYETLAKHNRFINRLVRSRKEGDVEPPIIEYDIHVLINLIKDNISLFRKYIEIDKLNNVLKENDPEEPSSSSFSDIFKIPQSYSHTFNVKYDNKPTFNSRVRYYRNNSSEPTAEERVSRDWIQEELSSMETQRDGLKEFSVHSETVLLSLMQYLSSENYMWQFENLNENAEPKYYPIAHAPVSSLYENGFFTRSNSFTYNNKLFTVDPVNKLVKYWETYSASDEENFRTMVEVFPKLDLN